MFFNRIVNYNTFINNNKIIRQYFLKFATNVQFKRNNG